MRDRVVELDDIPQSSVGAPCPMMLAGEHELVVAYFVQDTPAGWVGSSVRVVEPETAGEPAALVRFTQPPWDYQVTDAVVRLDVMGKVTSFKLAQGP